ncbi:hypothetical protein B4U80_03031 [Leptotrombidium deliense]|uniref:Uncharacterized protein n=1 Tax=Leptotrombidium deliense TaxID=299467 RepID=A0A443SGW7_9ACAR|nr:hypothetical protein B4U80_03031 [Leptotrombidium deliense]
MDNVYHWLNAATGTSIVTITLTNTSVLVR